MFSKKSILVISIAAVLTAAICYLLWFLQNDLLMEQEVVSSIVSIAQKDNGKEYIKLLFLGDIMFDRGIRYYADKNGSYKFIFDKISSTLKDKDLVVANLEGPITDNKSISLGTKVGDPNNFYFTFEPSIAKIIFDENIKLVNLGNNHILNFYGKGLASTKDYLDKVGVDYFGVPDGKRSTVEDIKGLKIAFISYNEFYGKPEVEKSAVIDEIKKYKLESDIVIVFCHWGVEYVKKPTSAQEQLAHQFVDAGADLIIGTHPHVTQTIEEYNGKKIYYSLGNFIFDMYFSEDVRNGLGVLINIDKQTKQLEFSDMNFYLDKGGQTILK